MSTNKHSGDAARFKQYRNPTTKHWAKHDTKTGRIVDAREDGRTFKGIPKGGQR